MKRVLIFFCAALLSVVSCAQDLTLKDIVNFSESSLKAKGFTGGKTLTSGSTTVTIRSGFRGIELTTLDDGLFEKIQNEAADAYGKPEVFHDTGVMGTVTEYVIDETEFIMFFTRTDSVTNEKSYHIGYAKGE